jgi:hypothetical protein
MSFFVKFDAKDFQDASAIPSTIPVRDDYQCRLEIHFDSQEGYYYRFIAPQYVLWHPDDTLTFTLDNKASTLSDMWILKHTSTEPGAVKLIDLANPTVDIPSSAAYGDKAQKVTMKLQLQRELMIHIGIIVAIAPKSGSATTYLLCDPQVGSGPP